MVSGDLYRKVWQELAADKEMVFLFLLSRNYEPFLLVEAKHGEQMPSAPLRKFQQVLQVPALQLMETGDRFRILSNGDQQIMVAPAWLWLAGLP
jgi:hypothetical protein